MAAGCDGGARRTPPCAARCTRKTQRSECGRAQTAKSVFVFRAARTTLLAVRRPQRHASRPRCESAPLARPPVTRNHGDAHGGRVALPDSRVDVSFLRGGGLHTTRCPAPALRLVHAHNGTRAARERRPRCRDPGESCCRVFFFFFRRPTPQTKNAPATNTHSLPFPFSLSATSSKMKTSPCASTRCGGCRPSRPRSAKSARATSSSRFWPTPR